ncbi:hypothetical protein PR048_009993 [Dryococelus australis]|uniref:Ropporin-1-like protein n=1 Tax=Dryococelus australis TaxID=614101 RepID=A0ABQ9I2F8_9NEOP|nr:hypothetical protein PR048_009993 [Dryococelus australis]
MSELLEDIFCSEQINIPPMLPKILKDFCKAVIRTQPYDLLKWSAMYFRALSEGKKPPVKERLEYPSYHNSVGVTRGYLKIIINAFRQQERVRKDDMVFLWRGMALDEDILANIFRLGNFAEVFDLQEFVAVIAGYLSLSLRDTMILLCELLTDDPEGGLAKIPFDTFCKLYTFLANIEGKYDSLLDLSDKERSRYTETYIWGIGPVVPIEQVNAVIEHLKLWSGKREGMVMPFNIQHTLCPPLGVSNPEKDF